MGFWMQENIEEDDGSGYAIKFYISLIRKNNKLFTYCSFLVYIINNH